jgi:hypothetical protein
MDIATQKQRLPALNADRPGPIVGLAAAAALPLALIPWLGPLGYPFRLLITLVHELSHGLAALLTGGAFVRFVVFANGEGLAYTAGGWRPLVVAAGYLGAALFGAGLILLGRSHRWSRLALGGIGAAVLLLALRYGVPSIFSAQPLGGLLATASGALLGAAFLFAARRSTPAWALFLTNLIAIEAGLTAFGDLLGLIGLSSRVGGAPATDAISMAELTAIPAIVWAVLWALIAAAAIGWAVWRAWLRPRGILRP